jgi:hypothetical protein
MLRASPFLTLILLYGCASGVPHAGAVASSERASLTILSKSAQTVTLRLKNESKAVLAYAHWFGQDPSPVPYCRGAGEIRICSADKYVELDGEAWIHEIYIRPGRTVKFRAAPGSAEQVGVHLLPPGKDSYLWIEVP